MKDFNKMEQSNDSSASQWEMTPAEIAEMKEEQSRRELAEVKVSGRFNRTEKIGLHESINAGETSKDRLDRAREQVNFWSREKDIEDRREYWTKEFKQRQDFHREIDQREKTSTLQKLKSEAEYNLSRRSIFQKGWDFITSGFSASKVADKYYKKYDDYLNQEYSDEVSKNIITGFNESIDRIEEQANRDISELNEWVIDEARINNNRRMRPDFTIENTSDYLAVKKSIRRNRKKNQK
ncbi:MAG: hypothetical protein Q4A21_00615 [bacterium]|nr:hypothetical protein [bacterium]